MFEESVRSQLLDKSSLSILKSDPRQIIRHVTEAARDPQVKLSMEAYTRFAKGSDFLATESEVFRYVPRQGSQYRAATDAVIAGLLKSSPVWVNKACIEKCSLKAPFEALGSMDLEQARVIGAPVEGRSGEVKVNDTQPGDTTVSSAFSVFFPSGKSTLPQEAPNTVRQFASRLKGNPSQKVTIIGFADAKGRSSLNANLSALRAARVKEAFIQEGVKDEQIEIRWAGSTMPSWNNATELGRAINRRVDLHISPRSDVVKSVTPIEPISSQQSLSAQK